MQPRKIQLFRFVGFCDLTSAAFAIISTSRFPNTCVRQKITTKCSIIDNAVNARTPSIVCVWGWDSHFFPPPTLPYRRFKVAEFHHILTLNRQSAHLELSPQGHLVPSLSLSIRSSCSSSGITPPPALPSTPFRFHWAISNSSPAIAVAPFRGVSKSHPLASAIADR